MPVPVEAFFLPIDDRADEVLFCLFYPAQREIPLGSILYVHPFAEEMNKSRRMAALQAHGLAQAGYAVLQVDLRGCGESAAHESVQALGRCELHLALGEGASDPA